MRHQLVRRVACFLALLLFCSSSKADINCATDVVGLCTPTTETIITEIVTEENLVQTAVEQEKKPKITELKTDTQKDKKQESSKEKK